MQVPEIHKNEIKEKLREAIGVGAEIEELTRHVEFQDYESIIKSFEVKEFDKQRENGVLNTIYSKLALKNF